MHDTVKEPPTNARNDWIDIRSDTVYAVVEVHRSRYLHNDIKANNILVENYSAVSIDFGKSRKISAPKIYKLTEAEQGYTGKIISILPLNYLWVNLKVPTATSFPLEWFLNW